MFKNEKREITKLWNGALISDKITEFRKWYKSGETTQRP